MDLSTDAHFESPTKRTRTNHSLDDKMRDAVCVWDEIQTQWDNKQLDKLMWRYIFTRGCPSKRKFAESRNINPHTFQHYTCSDKSKRRKLGTKIGKPPNKTQSQVDEEALLMKDKDVFGNYYRNLHQFGMSIELIKLQEQKEINSQLRQKMAYQRILSEFQTAPKSMEQKNIEQKYWDKELPRVCDMIGADKCFLCEEKTLLRRCHKTFGSAAVKYVGPGLNEWSQSGKVNTLKRRRWAETQIQYFKSVQARHALTVTSGVGSPTLLVAIDHLLQKYDQKRISQGLEASDLRHQLREENYSATQYLRTMATEKTSTPATRKKKRDRMTPINLSREKQGTLRRLMLSKIAKEERILDDLEYQGCITRRLSW